MIFRRDLRLDDNTALIAAIKQSERVIPCFIFDPRQVEDSNQYKSDNCIQFMLESLDDLAEQLHDQQGKLYTFYGNPENIIEQLIKKLKINAVFCNKDYTPFSITRDESLAKICHSLGIPLVSFDDALIHAPQEMLKADGTPYVKFTPYYRYALTMPVREIQKIPQATWYLGKIDSVQAKFATDFIPKKNTSLFVRGGKKQAEKILKKLENFENYAQTHDFPALSTTGLSAYNKFGCISVRRLLRELQNKLGSHAEPLIRQLYWRDFFSYVAYYSPFVFGHAFQEKYDKLEWDNNKQLFKRWCTGTTGFPIVDAGMRQLNKTGWMHNRVRLIVASFLVKDLHIDWRWGEKYFAQHLVDYDPSVNNGNWQWVASTGCDAQPYFRIFNPWLQQKKFDPECIYIKQWVPELAKLPVKIIHNWAQEAESYSKLYIKPIVDHAIESAKSQELFKKSKYSK